MNDSSYFVWHSLFRLKDKDSAVIDCHEAKKVKQARDSFFAFMKDFTSTTLEQTNVR
jgi:hypothetical protein